MSKKPILEPSGSLSTDRARAFRDRLEQTSVTRWEIFVSEVTKDRVREIARLENLTAGVAAEALLELGVEAYVAGTVSSASVPLAKSVSTSRTLGNESQPTVKAPSKPLVSYSSRSSSEASSNGQEHASSAALRSFFARAKSKRT